jgi:DNA polymerase-3 subunit gamma/tau
VRVLSNQIKAATFAHAYLFTGTRGTGKTTMARILAKGLNCVHAHDPNATAATTATSETSATAATTAATAETAANDDYTGEIPCGVCPNCIAIKEGSFIDVVELDAASNNGVDSIREIRDSVQYPPIIGKYKVYIIDEAHMLSKGAANALLKTLEEPPEHAVFILATTEPGKLPQTIRSRCLKLDFKHVSAADLVAGMRNICTTLGVKISQDALSIIARGGDGSVRDSLSLLEQTISGATDAIDRKVVIEALGMPDDKVMNDLAVSMFTGDTGKALLFLDYMIQNGKDERVIMSELIDYFRSALIIKFVRDPSQVIGRSKENIATISQYTKDFTVERINAAIYSLSKVLNESRWATHPRILLEMSIIEIATTK